MRWSLSVTVVLIATTAFAQQNDAERLYRAMENKIKGAKSLKISWDSTINSAGGKAAKGKGTIYLDEGNKALVEAAWEGQDAPPSAHVVSDGQTLLVKSNNNVVGNKPLPSKNFGASIASFVAPMGMTILSLGIPEADKAREAMEKIGTSAFKLGAKERILGKDAQIVEFEISDKKAGGGKNINAKIWIDTRTMTPLKREMFDPANPKENFMNETYTEFIIDPQLEPKLFELPK